MADLVLKSERQIQTQILAKLITELGLNDINPGSVIDVLTQAIAQQDFAIYYQIGQLSRLNNIDSLTGEDLDNKAFEYGLTRIAAAKAKGPISILREASFEKVSTTFYAGSPSPLAGDTQIDVNDASNLLIGSSGTLILGRGTNNEEEVPYALAPVDNTNFWRFTLTAPLANNHAVEETVILKQGSDEEILAGTTVIVPATGTKAEIQFTIDNDVTILAGEDRIQNVGVTAAEPGTDGNISIGAIEGTNAFPNPPFEGIRASNTSKFSSGRDLESDDALRDRIKATIPTLSRGIKAAISNAIVGLVDPSTAKRVVSASIVLPVEEQGDVKVYIDDGTGFEPTFNSQGFETILESATGGEQRLQVDLFPIVKAQVENNIIETYDMSSGALTLEYTVGSVSETVTFNTSDFRFPDIASAEEIVAAINDKATIIEARTSAIGTYITLTAKEDTNESIQVTGGTANPILGFPTDKKETINLYIDDVRQSKDGETAILDSGNTAPYNLQAIGAYPHTISLIIDGKSANPQTATIALADVLDPAAVTVAEILAVLNRDLAGLTATGINSNTRIRLESNTKLSSTSQIEITGGTLNDATNGLNFDTTAISGKDNDYVFNRELGIIQLTNPLVANQNVTLGSLYTRGKLRAATPELYSPNNGETLVISVDDGVDQTITFDATFSGGASAQVTANFINSQLSGGTAIVREIGSQFYLEINTNTYTSGGSIEIKSSSTANSSFSFPLDTKAESGDANKSYVVSSETGPYDFAEADSLVLVVNNDIINSTYSVVMNYVSALTAVTSATVFRDSALATIFSVEDELIDYYLAFTSGANTVSETIETVSSVGAGVTRYTFAAIPTDFANIAVNDLINISGLDAAENNGNFVIVAKGAQSIDVYNPDATAATLQSGDGVMSQRRRVTDYNQLTGELTVGTAFANVPSVSDPYIILPSTVDNLVNYISNTKITSFTLKGIVEGVEANTKLQLSSQLNGSDGYIQVTGGNANGKLGFDTSVTRGIQAYSYWQGLLALVHKTIYGDDTDLVSYPGVGAAGITFRVLAPTVKQISVELDITLREGISIASVENEVKSVVASYVNTLGVGNDVIIEQIRAAVIRITGITDVVLSEPAANIAIADNEIANVRDPDILIG